MTTTRACVGIFTPPARSRRWALPRAREPTARNQSIVGMSAGPPGTPTALAEPRARRAPSHAQPLRAPSERARGRDGPPRRARRRPPPGDPVAPPAAGHRPDRRRAVPARRGHVRRPAGVRRRRLRLGGGVGHPADGRDRRPVAARGGRLLARAAPSLAVAPRPARRLPGTLPPADPLGAGDRAPVKGH